MSKVGVIGYGVVGSGTVELFEKNRESISKRSEETVRSNISAI